MSNRTVQSSHRLKRAEPTRNRKLNRPSQNDVTGKEERNERSNYNGLLNGFKVFKNVQVLLNSSHHQDFSFLFFFFFFFFLVFFGSARLRTEVLKDELEVDEVDLSCGDCDDGLNLVFDFLLFCFALILLFLLELLRTVREVLLTFNLETVSLFILVLEETFVLPVDLAFALIMVKLFILTLVSVSTILGELVLVPNKPYCDSLKQRETELSC